jgi:hypothetical protein
MTFPKDFVTKLGLTSDELSGSMLVVTVHKIVTGKGRVIEEVELDELLSEKDVKKNGK